jgi:hypothetical protein
MWEIASNSVGNGFEVANEQAGREGLVDSPPRGVDRTGLVASTKPVEMASPTHVQVVGW